MSEDWRKELVQKIESAFADTPPPAQQKLVIFGWGVVTEGIQGKHWSEIDLDVLLKHKGTLSASPIDAFRYYLPAFLRAAVLHPDRVDTVHDSLIFLLTPPYRYDNVLSESKESGPHKRFRKRAGSFSREEKAVISAFLASYKELDEFSWAWTDSEKEELERGIQYWKKASTSASNN
jgi:hypothetical protein